MRTPVLECDSMVERLFSRRPVVSGDARQKIYAYLKHYIETHGYAPTVREVGAYLGLSYGSALYHLRWMERHGQIRRKRGITRGITLLSEKPVERTKPPARRRAKSPRR
nr:MAG: hypothetical protein DIU68_14030 [Chloroflexota bacterium]